MRQFGRSSRIAWTKLLPMKPAPPVTRSEVVMRGRNGPRYGMAAGPTSARPVRASEADREPRHRAVDDGVERDVAVLVVDPERAIADVDAHVLPAIRAHPDERLPGEVRADAEAADVAPQEGGPRASERDPVARPDPRIDPVGASAAGTH